jgi:hypothetical protein
MPVTRRHRARPNLDALEGRELLAVQVFESNGLLSIIGDGRANQVRVYDVDGNATPGEISDIEVLADNRLYVVRGVVERIRIDLGGGNDTLVYDLGDPSLIQTYIPSHATTINTGAGRDSVHLNVNGFGFADAPDFQALGPGTWNFSVDLGSDNDAFRVALDADVLGLERASGNVRSRLTVAVQGGGGNDALEFLATRDLDVQLAAVAVSLRGGVGNDTLTTTSDGEIRVEEATLVVNRFGEANNDRLLGVLDFATAGNAAVDQVINTGGGTDFVDLTIRQRSRRPRA